MTRKYIIIQLDFFFINNLLVISLK
jgi:hypothetical protein